MNSKEKELHDLADELKGYADNLERLIRTESVYDALISNYWQCITVLHNQVDVVRRQACVKAQNDLSQATDGHHEKENRND